MRVLIVSKAFVNRMYRRKLEELANLAIELLAVAPPAWQEGGSTQQFEAGIEGYSLRLLPLRLNGHFHLHYYSGLSKLIREFRPDVVHMDEEAYNLATFLGVRAARKAHAAALFFTWQNLLRSYPFPFSGLERAVYRWSSLAIAGSEDAANVVRAKGFRREISTIPQFGVDENQFCPGSKADGPFTIGYFNRLVPGKAPLLALRAFAALPSPARLVIAGDGPLRPEVESQIAGLGLEDRVSVVSRVPSSEMPALMRTLDALILPSLTLPNWKEQFGRVLIEAMASGVPVVGSSSGEIPHVIGDAGLVVRENDVQDLAGAMRRLMEEPGLGGELSARGRERVLQRFTHRRIAEATAAAYERAVQVGR
jgi:glycosyltransferase involved in cell wall biosynthesis